MIRACDAAAVAGWMPAPAVPARAPSTHLAAWLDDVGCAAGVAILGDVTASAQHLGVAQHAARVLDLLRCDADAPA